MADEMKELEELLAELEGDMNIITLTDEDGEETEFVEIDEIELDGKVYAILQPVELEEDMDEDEALVFCVTEDENGEQDFDIVLDDEILDAVFEKYNSSITDEE